MPVRTAPRIVIIAYGNPLRSDDGAAWHAAQLLRRDPPDFVTELLCVHQLTPEIAERAADADGVIFVDASQTGEPGKVSSAPAEPNASGGLFSHSLSPGQILALSKLLYEKKPDAFTISIAGESFDHGDALSKTLQSALPALVQTVRDIGARLAGRCDLSAQGLSETCGV